MRKDHDFYQDIRAISTAGKAQYDDKLAEGSRSHGMADLKPDALGVEAIQKVDAMNRIKEYLKQCLANCENPSAEHDKLAEFSQKIIEYEAMLQTCIKQGVDAKTDHQRGDFTKVVGITSKMYDGLFNDFKKVSHIIEAKSDKVVQAAEQAAAEKQDAKLATELFEAEQEVAVSFCDDLGSEIEKIDDEITQQKILLKQLQQNTHKYAGVDEEFKSGVAYDSSKLEAAFKQSIKAREEFKGKMTAAKQKVESLNATWAVEVTAMMVRPVAPEGGRAEYVHKKYQAFHELDDLKKQMTTTLQKLDKGANHAAMMGAGTRVSAHANKVFVSIQQAQDAAAAAARAAARAAANAKAAADLEVMSKSSPASEGKAAPDFKAAPESKVVIEPSEATSAPKRVHESPGLATGVDQGFIDINDNDDAQFEVEYFDIVEKTLKSLEMAESNVKHSNIEVDVDGYLDDVKEKYNGEIERIQERIKGLTHRNEGRSEFLQETQRILERKNDVKIEQFKTGDPEDDKHNAALWQKEIAALKTEISDVEKGIAQRNEQIAELKNEIVDLKNERDSNLKYYVVPGNEQSPHNALLAGIVSGNLRPDDVVEKLADLPPSNFFDTLMESPSIDEAGKMRCMAESMKVSVCLQAVKKHNGVEQSTKDKVVVSLCDYFEDRAKGKEYAKSDVLKLGVSKTDKLTAAYKLKRAFEGDTTVKFTAKDVKAITQPGSRLAKAVRGKMPKEWKPNIFMSADKKAEMLTKAMKTPFAQLVTSQKPSAVKARQARLSDGAEGPSVAPPRKN